ncbi:DNA primase [Prevotella melaninogenica]|uniref:DNA primase n=1 Tax=Prevotella melaninogenica TaxID=28132 RepID=A0ABS6Y3D6_9BACT|nr:DNA primase [Prevotella melaninogenica]MBW4753618.1 DNA primase [Prevotella melaninogenica]
MIDKNFIEKVKSALNIVNVIETFTRLHKTGANYKGVCPFHDDHSPSMVVSPSRQTYHCFVCGASGDVISFVQHHLNISFIEALRWCANQAGIEFPTKELTPEEEAAYKRKEAQRIAIDAAAKFFQKNLGQAESFLASRGYSLSDKALTDFGVGYAPMGNLALAELSRAGYSQELLQEVDVLGNSEGRLYDRFRDRLMFPFYDMQGHIIGFSGRIVTPNDKTGKYVNTGETPLFTKGKHIFGLYQARKSIGKTGFAYLVEGQFDVMSLHKVGVENVIGGSGTAFTEDQVKLLLRFTDDIIMIYDADPAGVKASLKNCELLLKAGAKVRCIRLEKGMDPDEFAKAHGSLTSKKLKELTEPFPKAFKRMILPRGCKDETVITDCLNSICSLVACVQDSALRLEYIKSIAEDFRSKIGIIDNKVRSIRTNLKESIEQTNTPSGIFGLDALKENLKNDSPARITSIMQEFLDGYGEEPIVYVSGRPSSNDIQELRRICCYFESSDIGCSLTEDGEESDYLHALADMYRAGIRIDFNSISGTISFLDNYMDTHGVFLRDFRGNRVPLISRCIELSSYADDTVITVNKANYCFYLNLTKGQFDELRKPFVLKRKSAMKVSMQADNLDDEEFDVNEPPDYVQENEEYKRMWKESGYYPRLNKKSEPVCYMFRNKNGNGMTQVADFFMTPLLHIFSDDFEQNKRVLRINRRYYETPIYIEIPSKAMLKMSSIEEVLINYEAVNFNGEEWQWKAIKTYMSRHFVMCSEVKTYGNQQSEGMSRKTDEQFFAFANGIFHNVDGQWVFDPVNELGVVTHNKNNYYLPAFSTIYAGSGKQSDKYELISQLVYKEVPAEKKVSFEKWASLMDQVYKINDNGKWALVFAIMCAFRSNIHCIDRLFTAPFFMGPMSSGKTQIAISIRSLFISPNIPIFNLNTGTDAAMSTIMGTFKDVPVVLDEYNNKDISDTKFQALKGIVYDGDGKQKRKGTSGREIENDKVFAPVIICGQETPQRDDNALMSRVIVCEVPKPRNRTPEEVRLFEELKTIEDPNKIGLSNVLLQILELRPMFMDHFRSLKQEAYNELKQDIINSGEMDRLMKTASLFLGTVKLIERYSNLRLPFTYDEFFKIVQEKVQFQLSLIRSTDKLAMFFTAVNNMIDTRQIIEGREFLIEQPKKVTGKDSRGDAKTFTFEAGANIMFLRLSAVFSIFDRSGYNNENSTLSTIEQNLRSHTSYVGTVSSRRFVWEETIDDTDLHDGSMVKLRKQKSTSTSAIIIDYDKFVESYNIDFRRDCADDSNKESKPVETKVTNTTEEPPKKNLPQDLPFEPSDGSDEPF